MLTGTLRRLGACLLVGVFAAFFGDSVTRVSCPMHSGTRGQADAHANHQGSSGGHSSQSAQDSHGCDCLGSCVGGASSLLGERMVRVPASSTTKQVRVAGAVLASPAPLQLRLPFANAPPGLTPA